MMFPKTIGDIEIISNLKVRNKTVTFAVCPNPKCSALYDLRWLKTVSSTFQDVDFDGSLLPLFIS